MATKTAGKNRTPAKSMTTKKAVEKKVRSAKPQLSRMMLADTTQVADDGDSLRGLADQFHALAFAIAKYRHEHIDDLSAKEAMDLDQRQQILDAYAGNFINEDIIGRLNGLPTDAITKSISAMKAAVANLKIVGKVFDIAAAAVGLGVAVSTTGPAGIVATFTAAQHLLQLASPSDPTGGGS